jgi:SAM-dependent methyltransferase
MMEPKAPIEFVCPSCRQSLEFIDAKALCAGCGKAVRMDSNGIYRFTEGGYYYREVPKADLSAILDHPERTKAGLLARFDQYLREQDVSYETFVKRYAFNAERGAGIYLLDIGQDSVVLDFGSGWGNLTRVAADVAMTVVSMDLTYESLLFSKTLGDRNNVISVHGGDGNHLPFSSHTFDAVILNGVLEWIPEGKDLTVSPRTVQERFLREVHRILKPSGQAYIGIENRFGLFYWFGIREDHTGLRFGALLPRGLSNIYSKLLRRKPYRTYTYGYAGYLSLLKDAGFQAEIYHPWMDYRDFREIHSGGTLKRVRFSAVRKRKKVLAFLGNAILEIAKKTSSMKKISPSYMIVGHKSAQTVSQSILSNILNLGGDSLQDAGCTHVSGEKALWIRTNKNFYKIPFTQRAREGILNEIRSRKEIRKSFPRLSMFLCDQGRILHYEGIPCFVTPLHAHLSMSEKELSDQVEAYFDSVSRYSRSARIEIFSNIGNVYDFIMNSSENGENYLAPFRKAAEGEWFPVGPTHGDFYKDNLLQDSNAKIRIVDWARFEPDGVWPVDSFHYFVKKEEKKRREDWWQVVVRMVESDLLRNRIQEAIGRQKVSYGLLLAYYALHQLEMVLRNTEHVSHIDGHWRRKTEAFLEILFKNWSFS